MKIILSCNNPDTLKAEIIKATDDNKLKTWETRKTTDGDKVLTHSTASYQWEDEVLLVLEPHHTPYTPDTLDVKISWWKDHKVPTREVQSYIIGRFTEILLAHFSSRFSDFRIEK